MNLYEYQGKKIFESFGIPIPRGGIANSNEQAYQISKTLNEAVLKVQILSGKRGKAGGIKFSSSPEETRKLARELFAQTFMNQKVILLLIEEKLSIEKEYYLAITYDYKVKKPVLLASAQGGMDIEEVPDHKIIKKYLEPGRKIEPYQGREIAVKLGLSGKYISKFSSVLIKLVDIFIEKDAELVEINPLVLTNNNFIAADSKITIDDDALFRQKDLLINEEKTELEARAHQLGLSYVELDGNIAIMANGAGITMATLDLIQYYGGRPANFLDAGGGASEGQTKKALELLLSTNPKGIFINIFGGITRTDDVARAFLKVREELSISIPVVIRLVGTNQQIAINLLKSNGIQAFSDMEAAAKMIVEKVKGA